MPLALRSLLRPPNAIDTGRLEAAGAYLEQISKRWDDALARLKEFVEK